MRISALVVDDEDNTRNLMLRILQDYIPEIEVIGWATNSKEGLSLANEKHPDVLFLDVEMPGGTGINLAQGLSYSPIIVFVTAHEHYAIKAIKAGAFDYLLKPVDIDELQNTVSKIKKALNEPNNNSSQETKEQIHSRLKALSIPVKEGILYIKVEDIICVEADGAYSTIFLNSGEKHVISKNLKEISEQLNGAIFFRCHASYIVNLSAVAKFLKTDGFFVQLHNGKQIPISRSTKDEFVTAMEKYRVG